MPQNRCFLNTSFRAPNKFRHLVTNQDSKEDVQQWPSEFSAISLELWRQYGAQHFHIKATHWGLGHHAFLTDMLLSLCPEVCSSILHNCSITEKKIYINNSSVVPKNTSKNLAFRQSHFCLYGCGFILRTSFHT